MKKKTGEKRIDDKNQTGEEVREMQPVEGKKKIER